MGRAIDRVSPVTLLDVQRGFVAAWQRIGLERLAPAMFDEPPTDTNPPFTALKLSHDSQERHSEGSVWQCVVSGIIRLPQGSSLRQGIEHKLALLTRSPVIVRGQPACHFYPAKASVEKDAVRWGGQPVETIPVAWDLWVEVLYG